MAAVVPPPCRARLASASSSRPPSGRGTAGWHFIRISRAGFAHGKFTFPSAQPKFSFSKLAVPGRSGVREGGGHMIRPEDPGNGFAVARCMGASGLAIAPSRSVRLSGPPATGLRRPVETTATFNLQRTSFRCWNSRINTGCPQSLESFRKPPGKAALPEIRSLFAQFGVVRPPAKFTSELTVRTREKIWEGFEKPK